MSVRRIAELVVEAMKLDKVEFSFTGTEGDGRRRAAVRLEVRRLNNLSWSSFPIPPSRRLEMTIQAMLETPSKD